MTSAGAMPDNMVAWVERKREVASLVRELGNHMGAAASEVGNLMLRPCPICGRAEVNPTIELQGAVYGYHRCRDCSLLYAPRLLRHDVTRRLYGERGIYRRYWETAHEEARRAKGRALHEALVTRLLHLVPSRTSAIVVGCGFGQLVAELTPHFRQTLGLELNRRTAQAATQLHQITVRTERLEKLARDEASVDLIVMDDVLEHLTDIQGLLDAAKRLLRGGGVLFIGARHGASLGLRLSGGSHPIVSTHTFINLFTHLSLKRLAELNGLVAEHIDTDDDIDLYAADWVIRRLEHRPLLLARSALAIDRAVQRMASAAQLPSRLHLGARLEAVLVKPQLH